MLCAILAPVGFVFGSRFIGTGPSSVMADSVERPQLPEALPVFSLPEPAEIRDTSEPIQSPFYIEPLAAPGAIPAQKPVQNRPSPSAAQQPLPKVSVTSILPNPRNPLAVIDGRPRRIGETLPSGWTVISINGEDNTVTLQHSTGAEIRAGLKNGS